VTQPRTGVQRISRIAWNGATRHVIEGDDGVWRLLEGDLFGRYHQGEVIDPPDAGCLPPVMPSKIVGVGLNYKDHAAEMGKPLPAEPLIFLKPPTAVIGPGEPIRLPPGAGRVDFEAELGVVIARRTSRVPAAEAAGCILGLTCVNDVTARELQARDVQYTRAKGFDTFAPIGPCIAVGLDGAALAVEGWVNEERRQASNTRELIFSLPQLVAYVSSVMTLLPGDIIATGTPAGVGPLQAGDRVTIRVEGVGDLTNPVAAG
jgi:2-keto-4-pentenoate hydratase/2-oxohepta-3-ene-1,7-dioic acid hydratase in catechol pathway